MRFQTPLVPGRLLRRYKRFLADVRLDDGTEVTAHCANPGAMTGLNQPGLRVWLEPNDDPKRKLRFAWRLAELKGGHWAGIDTSAPNRVVREALDARKIPALAGYAHVRAEVRYGERSRVDFLLQGGGRDTYVEVKNAHLSRQAGLAEFPDTVTARGARHLHELANVARAGARAVLLYVVQRTDCERFRIADDLDPAYAAAARDAAARGVEMLCFDTNINREGIWLRNALPIEAAR